MFSHLFNTYEAVTPPPRSSQDLKQEIYQTPEEEIEFSEPVVIASKVPQVDKPSDQSFNPELQVRPPKEEPKKYYTSNEPQEVKGPKSFEEILQKAEKINPEVSKYRAFLIKTAKRESNFNSYVQSKTGAPYYGYFQMGREEIRNTTGLSVDEFRNNPVQQVLGAVELYKQNLRIMKAIGCYTLGVNKGYSDDALVAGAWLGGPGGVKKYLLGKGDPSDSHWYKNGKGGTSVGKIMNNWDNHVVKRK